MEKTKTNGYKKIEPQLGGYFKLEGRIYRAIEPTEHGQCHGCCFHQTYGNHFECWAPPINCGGKIMVDVTGTVTDELIDDGGGSNIIPIIRVIAVVAVVLGFILYNLFN